MMKDILVDNTVAKNFCNPLDQNYKEFIRWLFHTGVLVVTQRLLVEYHATSATSASNTSMPAIIAQLMLRGRLTKIGKADLSAFRFPKHVEKSLRSNRMDHDSLKAVLLSVRRYALSHDDGFCHDVNSYPGYGARAERRPQDLPYAL